MGEIERLCQDLGFDAAEFKSYYDEDDIGGYPEKWPVGSVWASEGQILYAVTRCLKPQIAVEFGTRYGCSTAHILAAMDSVDCGMLFTVDNGANGLPEVQQHERLCQTVKDGVEYALEWDGPVDMIFEDGPHSTEFTRDVIKALLPYLKPGGIVLVHDCCHFLVGQDVSRGFREAVGDFGTIIIPPSDCGLGYWKKP